ncbi:ribosome maturation factor RimM [Candidatus Poriferisocius sp.]|uniref:ribosome maturation factor RimM n=1 Tax=Candidatus Poriferisocius sp. TaxID=3101276 RepID=UPI003B012A27
MAAPSTSSSSTDQSRASLLLEVGRIDRAHGVRGEVVVTLWTNRTERLEAGAVLASDFGDLTVADARAFQQRWIVRFAEISDRDTAESVRGQALRAEPISDPEELWVHELIGMMVCEADGTERGRVEAVQGNPASDLLVLESGTLVPLTFLVERSADRLIVDGPDGLFSEA